MREKNGREEIMNQSKQVNCESKCKKKQQQLVFSTLLKQHTMKKQEMGTSVPPLLSQNKLLPIVPGI